MVKAWMRRCLRKIAILIWLSLGRNLWEYTTIYREDDEKGVPVRIALTFSRMEDWEGKGDIHAFR